MTNNTTPKPKNKAWEFAIHPMTLFVAGIIISIAVGYFFYYKGLSDALADAKKQGFAQGLQDGQAQGLSAFEKGQPALIEQRYPGAMKASHDQGYAEGDKAGSARGAEAEKAAYTAGEAAGRAQGVEEGRRAAAADAASQHTAQDNWSVYAAAVDAAGKRAEGLAKRDNPELEKMFVAAVRAVIKDAEALHSGYSTKADAFDSTVEQIAKALAVEDFEQVRVLTITLRETLPVKKNEFFAPDKQIQGALDDLSKIKIP